MEKQRTAVFLLLMVLGAGMLAYGLHSQAAGVRSDRQSQATPSPGPAITQVAARGEVQPGESGEVKTTAAEPAEPAQPAAACPT